MAALKAKFIIEILGRPAEHLEKSLSELVDKIGTDKGVSLLHKEIHKAKKVEKAENLWTAFAELDLSFESLPLFFSSVMTYLPAHIEIYEPEIFKMIAFELNEFANFVVNRLHNYDALAKRMISEREILINKLEYIRRGGNPADVFAPATQEQTPVQGAGNIVKNKKKGKTQKKKTKSK